jgi:hypothetical protein
VGWLDQDCPWVDLHASGLHLGSRSALLGDESGLLPHHGLFRVAWVPKAVWVPSAGWMPKVDWVQSRSSLLDQLFSDVEGRKFWHGFHIWDPGGQLGYLVFFVLQRPHLLDWLINKVLVFQDSDFMAGGALIKFNLNHILDLGLFNCLSKNKHTQLCKFRLWFYFLFSWVFLELDWFYWSQ